MIYVVRHGQTDWNLEGRFQGRIDIPLNEKGKNQAKKTKEKLEGIEFDKVFSSPLKRALETAQIITNEPIEIDNRIIERCNGQLEGKLKTECENMVDFTDENEQKLGIESLPDFRGRITDFFDELEKSYVSGITFSGGDPLHISNVYEVTALAKEIKEKIKALEDTNK